MTDIRLAQFSGPLDLLLSMIQEKKLAINDIALSAVTEQYLSYVDKLEEDASPSEVADFLVIASRLLLMKARILVPSFFPDEEEDEQSLATQLRVYQAFVQASRQLHKRWLHMDQSFMRIEPPRVVEGFHPPENLNANAMRECMMRLLKKIAPLKPLPQVHIDKTVSLKEKIQQIRQTLSKLGKQHFFDIVEHRQNKSEVIVSFLALLELVKQRTVVLEQDIAFGDILIESVPST